MCSQGAAHSLRCQRRQTGVLVKVEGKVAAKRCAAAAIIAIMSAATLPGCAVAMLRGAAGSGGDSGGGTAGPASQPASDGSLSTAVRSRFGADPALKALKIVVDTHDGIVTLRGQVNTVAERNAAQAQARAVKGVKGVNNQLTVR
jgi:hyperosmotically inducible protein